MKKIKSKITKSELLLLYEEFRIKLDKYGRLPVIKNTFGGTLYNIEDSVFFVPNIVHSNYDETNEVHRLQTKEFEEEVFELVSDEYFKIYNRNQKINSL